MEEVLNQPMWDISYDWLEGIAVAGDADLIESCMGLYAEHYGLWGASGPRPGEPVRLPRRMLQGLLEVDGSWIACAYVGGRLVGFAAGVHFDLPAKGPVSWVAQLVVDQAYRESGVATQLLYGAWQYSHFYAWGLATSNPYAVRALESATRRPCLPSYIRRRASELLDGLATRVSYLPSSLEEGSGRSCCVNTEFFVDHSELPRMRERAARRERPWSLGDLLEGHEWFACTFHDQPPGAISQERVEELIGGSDSVWIAAYERMRLDQSHAWRSRATHEVDYAIALAGAVPGDRVLDVGCGDGRHSVELARRGFDVVALDISEELVNRASEYEFDELGTSTIRWQVRDARESVPDEDFALVLCLYDVIGSSAKPEDDVDLLLNIYDALTPGGFAVIGAMNSGVTDGQIPASNRPSDLPSFLRALEDLPASDTMESSGSVFDPRLMLVFDGVHYRKEQFSGQSGRLPLEVVIRDRRFDADELRRLLEGVGFEVVRLAAVRLGEWQTDVPGDDPKGKELLAVVRRPAGSPVRPPSESSPVTGTAGPARNPVGADHQVSS